MKMKKFLLLVYAVMLMTCVYGVPAYAASGDVAGAIEGTWDTVSQQTKTVVDDVVLPAIDLVLAVSLFAKLETAYFDYRKHGRFEQVAPATLSTCLVLMLTAPFYIWQILGM